MKHRRQYIFFNTGWGIRAKILQIKNNPFTVVEYSTIEPAGLDRRRARTCNLSIASELFELSGLCQNSSSSLSKPIAQNKKSQTPHRGFWHHLVKSHDPSASFKYGLFYCSISLRSASYDSYMQKFKNTIWFKQAYTYLRSINPPWSYHVMQISLLHASGKLSC